MILNSNNRAFNKKILDKTSPPKHLSKDFETQELTPKQLETQLKKDAQQQEHNRQQLIEDTKANLVIFIFKSLPWCILVLSISWCICAFFDINSIQKGIENALNTIISMYLGSLMSKHI